ncbi:DUF1330 domain-containing protein [Pseudochryseolinea flava]|uniref:DUF1330 domain-containing protein n=1 Tax=Pseudochryseolinea flava TaxID=2059302 RepID=A0A364XZQ5_9BACT|nr:DUF1330 domain-containing protein [Pseudochryseolinea flava]RAV98952.1 DUF1330 domain-containing protein [Pseudochryseolinea flava]
MIYVTQIVYIKEGEEQTFEEFESVAIPAIRKYNGKLLLRLRPGVDNVIESTIEKPYEIHIVEFASMADFESFKSDKDRLKFLHLKEKSVRAMMMIKGEKL